LEDDTSGELMKMNALIRANLGMDPKKMDNAEFAEAYNEAMWIEQFRLRNQAEMLSVIFGGKKTH